MTALLPAFSYDAIQQFEKKKLENPVLMVGPPPKKAGAKGKGDKKKKK